MNKKIRYDYLQRANPVKIIVNKMIFFFLVFVTIYAFCKNIYISSIATIAAILMAYGYITSENKRKSLIIKNILAKYNDEYDRLLSESMRLTEKYIDILYRKYKYGIQEDDYGNKFTEVWDHEFNYFFLEVIKKRVNFTEINEMVANYSPILNDTGNHADDGIISVDSIEFKIKNTLKNHIELNTSAIAKEIQYDDFSEISGHDFEFVCATELEKHGWHATITPGSGDQGIDVIASYDDVKIGVQCKKYSAPVGNSAVQEAFSGQRFYNLKYAAVVSISGYTKSAIRLAASTDVILLDFTDIPNLAEKLGKHR